MMESKDFSTFIYPPYYRSGRRATHPQEFSARYFDMENQQSLFYNNNLNAVIIKNGHYDRNTSSGDLDLKSKILNVYYGVKNKFASEIFGVRKSIFLFLLDWFLDFGTSIYHFSRGNWVSGTLTYLIVIFAGVVTTVGFLKDPQTRRYLQKDTYSLGLWIFILLHFPSWFPFVCLYMKLQYLLKQKKDGKAEEDTDTQEKVTKYTDLVLKANWFETVLESKPQALLQTILLLETDSTFTTIQDYLPLALSLWSIYSMTGNIYSIVRAEAGEDKTETYSKFYGYTYTVLSNLAPAMCINTTRNFYETNTEKFCAFLAAILVYYVALHIVERISLILSNFTLIKYGKIFHVFVTILFLLILSQWIIVNKQFSESSYETEIEFSYEIFILPYTIKSQIVTGIFLVCVIANLVFFWIARDFAEVSFKLKNDLVEEQSKQFKSKIKSLYVRYRK